MNSTCLRPGQNGWKVLGDMKIAVKTEREASLTVLHYLREVHERKLYSWLKYSSLLEFAMKEHGYSETAALRRINAAILLKQIPEIEEKIESGVINLTQINQAQRFFRQEAQAEKALSPEQKKEVLVKLENKSTRESERILLSMSSTPQLPKASVRPVSSTHTAYTFIADEKLDANLERIRDIWAHAIPSGDWNEILTRMAEITLEKIDPLRKAQRAVDRQEKKEKVRSGQTEVTDKSDISISKLVLDVSEVAVQKNCEAWPPSQDKGFTSTQQYCAENTRQTHCNAQATQQVESSVGQERREAEISGSRIDCNLVPEKSNVLGCKAESESKSECDSESEPESKSKSKSKSKSTQGNSSTPAGNANLSRYPRTYIHSTVHHHVWMRDGGSCVWMGAEGERCGSRRGLELDHIVPVAMGGDNSPENLRLLCRSHNTQHAIQRYGLRKMQSFFLEHQ